MSEPPETPPPGPPVPPNPYGGTPGQPPGYPPFPAGAYEQPRRDRWKIWLGIGLSIPVLFVCSVVGGLLTGVDSSGAASAIVGLAAFVGPIVMLFFDSTRKIGIGLFIGYGVLFILAAGACVVLLASLGNGYN